MGSETPGGRPKRTGNDRKVMTENKAQEVVTALSEAGLLSDGLGNIEGAAYAIVLKVLGGKHGK